MKARERLVKSATVKLTATPHRPNLFWTDFNLANIAVAKMPGLKLQRTKMLAFDTSKHFYPSLMFARKARDLPKWNTKDTAV
jgi:hypothetical protein